LIKQSHPGTSVALRSIVIAHAILSMSDLLDSLITHKVLITAGDAVKTRENGDLLDDKVSPIKSPNSR
jgi:hypothetical protein